MRIKEILRANGMTAKELASVSGITEANISYVINGKGNPSLQTLTRIASALGVEVGELFVAPSPTGTPDFIALVKDGSRMHTAASWDELKELAVREGGQLTDD